MTKIDLRAQSNAKRQKRRDELIGIVKRGLDMTGNALQELKDDGYWEDTHTSWIAFCKETFGISKTKLFNLLKYTEVVGSLSKENQSKITTIDQALALAKLPEESRNAVVSKAENNGGITAENLKFHGAKPAREKSVTDKVTHSPESGPSTSESAESKTPSKPKTPPPAKERTITLDKVGTPIPDDALPYWNRRHEVQSVLTQISKIRTMIKSARDKQDCLWVKHGQDAYEYLSRAYSYISDALPHAVCLQCQGSYSMQEKEGCSVCGNTGLISEYRFDHYLPKELREIRLRSNADLAAKTEK